ncbi:mycothiol system anti-sigma-R factor [Gordonia sp. (in: high G+C Gram-positive bacteria)]|uniref:mycothiol system anti-sigma-R factor n=1 Tax=Gordonia sp. (in: high G+C Gram-positive bacteria) TaxID=84139 RepID=UPI003C7194F6
MSTPNDGPSEFANLDCSAVLADIWLLLDNECDSGARARLEGHVNGCPSCLEQYGIEQQIKALVSRKCGGEHAPDSLRERLRIKLRTVTIQTTTTYRIE